MILICAPLKEQTVNNVIMRLLSRKISFKRISKEEHLELKISNNDYVLNEISPKELSAFWYRKGDLEIHIDSCYSKIQEYCNFEFLHCKDILFSFFERAIFLGNYSHRIPNKLFHLSLADSVGLSTPAFLITTSKKDLINFKKKYDNIITKSIDNFFSELSDNVYYFNHTERLSDEILQKVSDNFFPSLFQEEIPKKYELRIIFVENKFWVMAIFSQSNEKTIVDWRNEDDSKPNRKIPYKLPIEIEKQIKNFICKSGLNTGAIDMIVTRNREYVFLECNPNGQIGMVSEHCNYYIEKYIAEYLSTP